MKHAMIFKTTLYFHLWGNSLGKFSSFKHDNAPVHKVSSIKNFPVWCGKT